MGNKLFIEPNPFQKDNGYWFWYDETGEESSGYVSFAGANTALLNYCNQLEGKGMSVPELLEKAKQTYKDRSAVYGEDGHSEQGRVLKAIFPNGITLTTEEEFTRFILFIFGTAKFCRYGKSILKGGHKDSIHDVGVYSFILEDFDEHSNNGK